MIEPVIPIHALEHLAYCERQAAIVHVEGFWRDNEHTVRGVRGHRRVDEGPARSERGRQVLRGVALWSERFGLSGRADAVEIDGDAVWPVEYKSGVRHGRAAEVQMCAQALCLEEMLGTTIRAGYVWYAGHRRRQEVPVDRELRQLTVNAIDRMRSLFGPGPLPPAPNDRRCNECQVRGYCLPSIVAEPKRVAEYVSGVLTCWS